MRPLAGEESNDESEIKGEAWIRYCIVKISLPSKLAVSAICTIAALIAADEPKFETASVKRMERGVISNSLGPGTVILRGDPLKVVLMEASQVKMSQIVGPSWLDEDCFEIIAKMPEGATKDQIPAMLQALLVERFKLAAHKEARQRPVYALFVDKNGPKFKEADSSSKRPSPGQVTFRAGGDTPGLKGAMTMASLARFLTNRLDRPVQDFTGLKGTYDIDLFWAPDPGIERQSTSAGSYAASAASAAPSGDAGAGLAAARGATIFTAVRELPGLRLESRNEQVEMLVIDHVERVPTEN